MVTKESILSWLDEVCDPEIPVLSLADLGVLRGVEYLNDEWQITITPTYSGCPAMKTMEDDILKKLKDHGVEAKVHLVLSPAWTTDWLSESGRIKLT